MEESKQVTSYQDIQLAFEDFLDVNVKLIYYTLSILVFVSCQNEKEIIFSKTDHLLGNVIFKNDTNLLNVMEMRFIDSLIVFEKSSGSPRFMVYQRNTHKFLGGYGYIGKGPSEFLAPGEQLLMSKGKPMAWVVDFYKNNLSLLNVVESINKGSNRVAKKLKFPKEIKYVKQPVITQDSVLIGGMSDVGLFGRFVFYDLVSSKYKFFGELPDINRSSRLKEKLYGFISSISPNQKKFVVAMHYFNRLEIYDSKGTVFKVLGESLNNAKNISDRDISSEKLRSQYSGVYSTDSYIFALKLDVIETEEDKDKEVYVEVFDWEGNPVHKFILAEYAQGVAYDEKKKILYTVNYWTHGNIIKYDLSSFL